MATIKTTALLLRFDPAVEQNLRAIAAREHRSLANRGEVMSRDPSQKQGVILPAPSTVPPSTTA